MAWTGEFNTLVSFGDAPAAGVHNVMACNMYGAVLLTREIIASLKERHAKTGKRSCITFTSAMAALAPIPRVGLYAATKIFTDFVTWGLITELAKYKVDVSGWRAAGVSTNIIGNPKIDNPMMASPEQYVNAAFSKVTSGVHSGYFPHEIVHLVWTNLNDILPISYCQTFFRKLFESHLKEENKAA